MMFWRGICAIALACCGAAPASATFVWTAVKGYGSIQDDLGLFGSAGQHYGSEFFSISLIASDRYDLFASQTTANSETISGSATALGSNFYTPVTASIRIGYSPPYYGADFYHDLTSSSASVVLNGTADTYSYALYGADRSLTLNFTLDSHAPATGRLNDVTGSTSYTYSNPSNVGTFTITGAGGSTTASFSIAEVTGIVPEPATWLMMIFGFCLVGSAVRRGQEAPLRPMLTA